MRWSRHHASATFSHVEFVVELDVAGYARVRDSVHFPSGNSDAVLRGHDFPKRQELPGTQEVHRRVPSPVTVEVVEVLQPDLRVPRCGKWNHFVRLRCAASFGLPL